MKLKEDGMDKSEFLYFFVFFDDVCGRKGCVCWGRGVGGWVVGGGLVLFLDTWRVCEHERFGRFLKTVGEDSVSREMSPHRQPVGLGNLFPPPSPPPP